MNDGEGLELYAWIGEDELGSGRIGLKQAVMPAGFVPLVVMDFDREKIDNPGVIEAMEMQAKIYGKKIRLVKLRSWEIMRETKAGRD